jgi:hypothetical protein
MIARKRLLNHGHELVTSEQGGNPLAPSSACPRRSL